MTYNTGKPVPSRDPRDLIDNAESFDIRATSRDVRSTPDRLGISRKTWYGMEQDFAEFLAASGFEPAHLVYQDGVALQVDRPTQLVDYEGSAYRVKMPANFPVVLTGAWAADADLLVDVGDMPLRQDIADAADPAKGAGMVGYRLSGIAAAVGRSVWGKLGESVSVKDFGAIGDGVTDDSAAFQACALYCQETGSTMHVPAVDTHYLVTEGVLATQYLVIQGDNPGAPNVYFGPQTGGSRIFYTGSGDLFAWDNDDITGTTRPIGGSTISDLILIGTASAKNAIRVGSAADVGSLTRVRSNFNINNVYVGDFKHGYGVSITWCFANQFTNLVIQNCGAACHLFYAHATRFIGGNIEQSMFGLDAISSYGVLLSGTTIQGIDVARGNILGLAVPDDFFVWSDGWDGTGYLGLNYTEAWNYSGVAVRNYGSSINIEGAYWELCNIGVLNELDSSTTVRGGICAQDGNTLAFLIAGHGGYVVDDVAFQTVNIDPQVFAGLIIQEKNASMPGVLGLGCTYSSIGPAYVTAPAPESFVGTTSYRNIEVPHCRITKTRNVFEIKQRMVLPPVTGPTTVDLAAAGTNKVSQTISGSVTYNFTWLGSDAPTWEGAEISVHVRSGGASTVIFGNEFKVPQASYAMSDGTQAVFSFEYAFGYWVLKYAPLMVPS